MTKSIYLAEAGTSSVKGKRKSYPVNKCYQHSTSNTKAQELNKSTPNPETSELKKNTELTSKATVAKSIGKNRENDEQLVGFEPKSRRMTRSQSIFVNKEPVFTSEVSRKRNSTKSKKCDQHFSLNTTEKTSKSTVAKGMLTSDEIKITSKGYTASSIIIAKDKQDIPEQFIGFESTPLISRRMTRSQSICLAKAQILNSSTPNLATSKSKKNTEKTPKAIVAKRTSASDYVKTTPRGNLGSNVSTGKENRETDEQLVGFGAQSRRMTRSQSICLAKAQALSKSSPNLATSESKKNTAATPKAVVARSIFTSDCIKTTLDGNNGVIAKDTREDEESFLGFEAMPQISRSMTISQSICSVKAQFSTLKSNRNSHGQHVPNQTPTNESATNVLSPATKNEIDAKPKTIPTSKKIVTPNNVKILFKNKSVPTPKVKKAEDVPKNIETDKVQTIVTLPTLDSRSISDESDTTNVCQASNLVVRRSVCKTQGISRKMESSLMPENLLAGMRVGQTLRVVRRRHTIDTFQARNYENAITTSIQKETKWTESNEERNKENRERLYTMPTKRNIIESSTPITREYITGIPSRKQPSRHGFEIKISGDLKNILIADARFIKENKLYEIPLGFNVAEVIETYVTMVGEDNTPNSCAMTITVLFQGIIEYFDSLIGRQLLYEPERVQYEMLLNNFPGVAMSKIYPPIYLLRLLVQFNKLLHLGRTTDEILKFSIDHLNKFIVYLTENQATYFKSPR